MKNIIKLILSSCILPINIDKLFLIANTEFSSVLEIPLGESFYNKKRIHIYGKIY